MKCFPRSLSHPVTHTHQPSELWISARANFPVHAHSLFWQGWLRGVPIPPDCSHLPAHLPCPSLSSSQHHKDKAPWCAILAYPGLFFRGKRRCEKVLDNFPIFFVQIALNRLCLYTFVPCRLWRNVFQTAKDAETFRDIGKGENRETKGGKKKYEALNKFLYLSYDLFCISQRTRVCSGNHSGALSEEFYRSVTQHQHLDKKKHSTTNIISSELRIILGH